METQFSVRQTSFNGRPAEALALFAISVSQRMAAISSYQTLSTEISELGILAEQYQEAIKKAEDRAIPHVVLKGQLRAKVKKSLNAILKWLKFHDNGDPMWLIDAGFPVSAKEKRQVTALEAPFNLRLINGKSKGQLKVVFQLHDFKAVKTNAVEYSIDNGVTWQNGNYGGIRILLTNLPSEQPILVRVRSIGPRSIKSPWSEEVRGIVL